MISDFDPVVAEVISGALTAVTEEIEIAILRSAYSQVVKEAQDASCAIFTEEGSIVAQPVAIPGHLGSMKFMLQEVLKEFPADALLPGDMLISNDPYRGGSHLPDIALFRPVFEGKTLIAFVGSIAHYADVGGMVPGSNPMNATEIFQEGLVIPPAKLYESNRPNPTLLSLIRANVRLPEVFLGDLRAQEAALCLGERRIHEVIRKYGIEALTGVMRRLIDLTETRAREEISAMPRGSYVFEDFMDHDGINISTPVKICCRLVIDEGHLRFDFTGTDRQVQGPLNAPVAKTWTTVFFCVKCVLSDAIPFNDGLSRVIDIHIPEGTLLNPVYPAPVNARSITVNRVADTVLGAFALALPDRVGGQSCGTPTGVSFGGVDPRTHRRFVFYESYCGGLGATNHGDGADGVSTGTSNQMNIPVEAVEINYPVRVTRYELVPDSGGAGKFRGGLGILREYEMLADEATVNLRGDRANFAPKGVLGGRNGGLARYVLNAGTSEEKVLPSKYGGRLLRGQRLRVITPGGGGCGDPAERDPKKAQEDVTNGRIILESS
ncbi:MAG: hydantoinase B/oxoprolinase family protein [Deltaproteobacteria bacterium]|nr:hydantoinase B/oxoprolinase family protein [Deltaproteobacteria bacterium]